MRQLIKTVRETLVRLHRDERGAEGLEKILIIAAIVLPILIVLVFFREELTEWLSDSFEDVRDDADVGDVNDPF